jgi:hypothetical protein
MNIIGLGGAGCKIAKSFEMYPQYTHYYIDSEQVNHPNYIRVQECSTHEEYEKNYNSIDMSQIQGDATLIFAGSGKITGILLRLLEDLRHIKVSILYIKPDMATLDESAKKREKIVFGVLQQYARSGLISGILVANNDSVEAILENVSIANYWQEINNVLSSSYHMLNVFENTEPMLSTMADVKKTVKISTMGVVAYKNFDEKIFYNLVKPRAKKYFFGISEKTLNEEKDLLHRIRSYVKGKSEDGCTASFAIYSTNYEQNYVYVTQHASLIQEQNVDF